MALKAMRRKQLFPVLIPNSMQLQVTHLTKKKLRKNISIYKYERSKWNWKEQHSGFNMLCFGDYEPFPGILARIIIYISL